MSAVAVTSNENAMSFEEYLEDLVSFNIRAIVPTEDAVRVNVANKNGEYVIQTAVSPKETALVIGKDRSTFEALKKLVSCVAGKEKVKITLLLENPKCQ